MKTKIEMKHNERFINWAEISFNFRHEYQIRPVGHYRGRFLDILQLCSPPFR